jgi:hypothetical protein
MGRGGERLLSDGTRITWPARDQQRVRPISGANCNRIVSVLRRAYSLGKETLHLETPLTFPQYDEGPRGECITEDQCRAICEQFQAREGATVKADIFRLAYLTDIRKGRLRNARKRHVLIAGETWKLRWPKEGTKSKKHEHVLVLVGEELAIVERAWAKSASRLRLPVPRRRQAPWPDALGTQADLRAPRYPLWPRQGHHLPRHPTLGSDEPRCLRDRRGRGGVDNRPR